jgi:hypothetical protein
LGLRRGLGRVEQSMSSLHCGEALVEVLVLVVDEVFVVLEVVGLASEELVQFNQP